MTAQLISTVNDLTHERDWSVMTDHADAHDFEQVRMYIPTCNGPASLAACETWLANRGFVVDGDMPPNCFEYTRKS